MVDTSSTHPCLNDWLTLTFLMCILVQFKGQFPLLFFLFITPLVDITTLTKNANDNYLSGNGEKEKKLLKNCIKETKNAMK